MITIRELIDKLRIFTSKDLEVDETLNTFGNIPTGVQMNQEIYNSYLISAKQYYLSRFLYTNNVKLDIDILDDTLFHWGRCAVVKYGDSLIVGRYSVIEYDFNRRPFKIVVIPRNSPAKLNKINLKKYSLKDIKDKDNNKEKPQTFTVGLDAVIFDVIPTFWVGLKTNFGAYFLIDPLLKRMATIWEMLDKNLILGRTFISVPATTDKDVVKQMENVLLSTNSILQFGNNSTSTVAPSLKDNTDTINFTERSEILISEFMFCWEQVKTFLGCPTNANSMKAERQITQELSANNAFSDYVADWEFNQRKQAVDQLNTVFGTGLLIEKNVIKNENDTENDTENEKDKEIKNE